MVHRLGQLHFYSMRSISKGIIFDFDGVVVDSVSIKTKAFAELYKHHGDKIVQKVIKFHENNGGVSRYEKIRFFTEQYLNIEPNQIDIMNSAEKFSSLVVDEVIKAPYITGAFDYITKVSKDHKLFISTGTPQDEILKILEGRGISHFFTQVYGSPEAKTFHIDKIKNDYSFNSKDLTFFGDSSTDLEAASLKNVQFILVKNIYNEHISKSYNGKKIENFLEIL